MQLIFVYNAEKGMFNALTDTIHKVFSPATYECRLCHFTYGVFGMVRGWKQFLESLGYPLVFYHRPEFWQQYQRQDIRLPAIVAEREGELTVVLTADEINACQDLDTLMRVLSCALERLR